MKIKSIHVQNYRCLRDVVIPVEDLSVLLGANGCGKSGLFGALNLFYNTDGRIAKEDFYNGITDKEISITVQFSDLSAFEEKMFNPYMVGKELSVEKVISYVEPKFTQIYHGMRFLNPEFEQFRKASGVNMRTEYEKLREKTVYSDFPKYSNKEAATAILESWEMTNKEKCIRRRDDGQFFGFRNVGMHRLEKFTKFIFIPAVQEASEEGTERRGSVFEEIMQIVVKGSIANNEEMIKLQEETEKKYKELIDPSKNENLLALEGNLSTALSYLVPDSAVNINWIEQAGIQINPPTAFVKLREGGYENTIDRCGHGLQRAYVLALFQQLAFIQTSTALTEERAPTTEVLDLPSLIIGIEEPELYQHPDRQRHFCRVLLELSKNGIDGVVKNIQVFYSTHSPLLVDFQRFNELRIFRKSEAEEEDNPKVTKVTYSTLSQNARFIEKVKELTKNDIKDEELRQRLVQIMTPWMNEGFFGKMVVLVEGIKDRALVLGEALSEGLDFEQEGITVIPCGGKTSLPEIISIYKSLSIPTYVIWDSDAGKPKGIETNKRIQRCFDVAPVDYPAVIAENYCCTKTDLERTFREEIGDPDSKFLQKYTEDNVLGDPTHAMENENIVCNIIKILRTEKRQCKTLVEIVKQVMNKFKYA